MAASVSQVSRRYAEALLAACSDDEVEAVAQELTAFSTAVQESFDLKNVLLNPTFGDEERRSTLEALMAHIGLSERTQRFIVLLIERERQGDLESIAEAFAGLVADKTSKATAIVRTAAELDPSTQEQLKWALEKRTGKKLEMDVTVDPSLIGGIRAEVGMLVFDGTIKAELDKLRESLRAL